MGNLIEKLLESKDAKLDRAYKLTIKAFNENPRFGQIDSTEVDRHGALITEINKGLDCSRERTFHKFKGRYLACVQKVNGEGLIDNIPFGYVKAIIQISGKPHYSRNNYDYGPTPTLDVVDPNLWSKCLENRKKVLDQIVEKYRLKTYWNDYSAFDYLLGQTIGGYNYLKGKKFVDLDEKEVVKRSENFMNALREWAYNDPSA